MTKDQALEYLKTECARAGVPFEICLHNLKTGHRLKRYPEGTKFTDWVRTEVIKLQPYGLKTLSEIVGGKPFFAAWGMIHEYTASQNYHNDRGRIDGQNGRIPAAGFIGN